MKKQRLKAQTIMPNLAVCLKAYPDTPHLGDDIAWASDARVA